MSQLIGGEEEGGEVSQHWGCGVSAMRHWTKNYKQAYLLTYSMEQSPS